MASTPSPEHLQRLIDKFEIELAERRKIEQELAHLASFAEMDPNCIVETDLQGKVLYRNIVAQDEFPDLIERGLQHPLLEGLEGVIQVFQNQEKTLLSRPVKVGEKVFQQQITLIDRRTRLRIYVTDISELKRLDQLKTDFVNMVSHELRTPLTGLQAAVRMLQGEMLGPLTNDQKESLNVAVSSIDRLRRLVNNLLDSSKIEAGKLELHYQFVTLGDLIHEVQQSFDPLARERGLEIRLKTSESVRLFIDRDKIVQVLTNLVQNAMKFTAKGWVELAAESRGGEVVCSVADSGPGIAPADLSKLFGKFQQIARTPGTEKGTGLGLSICKGIVELHRGKIWVESRVGEGTRFLFSLPNLSAEAILQQYVSKHFEEAVALSKPLCLFAFQIKRWPELAQRLGEAQANSLMDRLETLIRSVSRQESDPLIRIPGCIWLISPGVDLSGGQKIADRVEQSVMDFAFQSTAQTPVNLDSRVAAYPDHGKVAEQLLAQILPPSKQTESLPN